MAKQRRLVTKYQPAKPSLRLLAGVAVQALQVWGKLMEANFPAADALQLAKVMAVLTTNPDVMALEKTRAMLVQKYGEQENGVFRVSAANMPAFMSEFQPLTEATIEVELEPLPLAVLGNAPQMTPGEMMALRPFFKEN